MKQNRHFPTNNRKTMDCFLYILNARSDFVVAFKYLQFFFLSIFFISVNIYSQQNIFSNVADSMGIVNIYNGESFGGGVSFCDFDGDDFEDLSLASWEGEAVYLFKNNDSSFVNVVNQTNISDTSRSKTLLWVDFDNDGDKDLFVANFGASNKIFRNNGNNVFEDITIGSGITTAPNNTIAACVGDYDNDGWLDVYITNRDSNTPNYLYHNEGNWTFTDVTVTAGVADSSKLPLAVAFFDYNNDGFQDIYIANDRMGGNTLFRNMGDGTFSDVSAQSNSNLPMDAMGLAIGDYDNDFDLDLYISNTESGNALLRNNGDETFTEIADSLGIAVHKICWGVNFIDYDNDSDLDLYVSVNHPMPQDPDVRNILFENLGNGDFHQATGTGFESDTSLSWGNAIGDYNNDGYCDIADLNSVPTKFALWKNGGGSNNWIKIKMQGRVSNRDGIGSIIEIYKDGTHFMRSTHCGISYISQNSSIQTIGVGNSVLIDSIIIKWPSGIIDVLKNVNVNQMKEVVEGQTTDIVEKNAPLPDFRLSQNYPNPFNPKTVIHYRTPKSGFVNISIYNTLGQKIRTLIAENQEAGDHHVEWDATDDFGNRVSSGIFFYRISVEKQNALKKMILIK